MPVETDADRALFVDADEFGASVSWQVGVAAAVTVSGIFDADYNLLTNPLLDEGMEGASPRLLLPSADLPAGAGHGDTLTIAAVSYTVVEIKPDGTGMSEVRLQEA